jgi:hypothetical protein
MQHVAAIGNYLAKEFPGGQLSMEPVPHTDRVRFTLKYGPLHVAAEVPLEAVHYAVQSTAGTEALADQLLSELRDHLEIYRVIDVVSGNTIWRGTRPERFLGHDPSKATFMERMASDGSWSPVGVTVSPRKVAKQAHYGTTYAAPSAGNLPSQQALADINKFLTDRTHASVHSTGAARARERDAQEKEEIRKQIAEVEREKARREAEERELVERARREAERLERERIERIRRSATGSFEPVDSMISDLRRLLGQAAEKEAALRDQHDEDALFGTAAKSVQNEVVWAEARKKLAELQAFVNERVEELDARVAGRVLDVEIADAEAERVLSRQQERNALEYTSLEDVPIEGPIVAPERAHSDLDDFLDVLS